MKRQHIATTVESENRGRRNQLTSEKLEETISDFLYDYWARHRWCKDGCETPDDSHDQIKQLIRDCIEAVTPTLQSVNEELAKVRTPDMSWYNSQRNAIFIIEANTKELLG